MPKHFILIILDGWGLNPETKNNAVAQAKTPVWDKLLKDYPWTKLEASAQAVGLPEKTIGNSEVGHMNIGAGRIVYQDLTRINASIEDKTFFKTPVLLKCKALLRQAQDTALHLMGLLSDGGVHSHIDHLFALLDFTKQQGIAPVYVHCFMDGRDTPPHAGKKYIENLENKIKQIGHGAIATVCGRYYAMDRDKRFERTNLAYQTIVCGEGEKFTSASQGVSASYEKGTTDEFILPFIVESKGLIKNGDHVLFFNFRADRARQMTNLLNEKLKLGFYITMTRYENSYPYPTVFPPQNLDNVLGEVLSQSGLKQFRIAETEKYAHVTYFFNGGREVEFPGEERCLIPSPRDVATYDLKPEMSAHEVTEEVLKRLNQNKYDVIILNFANPDMVGHSGKLPAAIKACETTDICLGKILERLVALGGCAIVTADHGNAECVADEKGNPHTAHTLNLVPLILVDPAHKNRQLKGSGKLCDIAPTILQLLGIPKPKEMTGDSLLTLSPGGRG